MALSDFAHLLNHRDGAGACDWSQATWLNLFTAWHNYPSHTARLWAESPQTAAWVQRTFVRWVRGWWDASRGMRAHLKWPGGVAEAWGLAHPPSPYAVLIGFMRPDDGSSAMPKPKAVDPLDWAAWTMWTWGADLDAIHEASGFKRPWAKEALSRVIKHLMATRLDVVCWALNMDKASIPDQPFRADWYRANEMWIIGQRAIGRPYVAADIRILNSSRKETLWPSTQQLVKPRKASKHMIRRVVKTRWGKRMATRREERAARHGIFRPKLMRDRLLLQFGDVPAPSDFSRRGTPKG